VTSSVCLLFSVTNAPATAFNTLSLHDALPIWPWQEDSEARLIREALAQVELADRLGIDYAWEVEHHFLEEYSHSSAPEECEYSRSEEHTSELQSRAHL